MRNYNRGQREFIERKNKAKVIFDKKTAENFLGVSIEK